MNRKKCKRAARLCLSAATAMGLARRASAQLFLFDATKAEMAANADWVVDADVRNIGTDPTTHQMVAGIGNESNPQRFPTPAASGITQSTAETYWSGALSSYGVTMVKHGFGVETLPNNGSITFNNGANPQDLSHYKVFVVCEPNILFTAAQKTAIVNFVSNGGGLMMIGDHGGSDRNSDGNDSVDVWNDLATSNGVATNPFGITLNGDSTSPSSTNVDTTATNPVIHGRAGNVTQ